jgi:hypothetical protein
VVRHFVSPSAAGQLDHVLGCCCDMGAATRISSVAQNYIVHAKSMPHARLRVAGGIMKYLSNQLAVAALLLSCLGILMFFEFIRPFRDPTVDVPLSLATWSIGAVFAIIAFLLPGRLRALYAVGILFKVLPLLCALALLWLLSYSNLAWH